MTLAWLAPAALAALAALLLPLALHLARRRQQPQTVLFAALQWLGTPQRPQRRWRIVDPWLLLVRLALLAAVIAALAQPVLHGIDDSTHWELVVPGADIAAIAWRDPASERRWLAPGFPALETSATAAIASPAPGATASLLREADALLPPSAALTVHVPAVLDGLDGARITLGRDVGWQVRAADVAIDEAQPPPPPRVAVAGAAVDDPRLRYLDAAHAAWHADASTMPRLTGSAVLPGTDALLWLSDEPLPPHLHDWLATGGRVLALSTTTTDADASMALLWQGRGGATLRAMRIARGRLQRLDCPLVPECLPELLDAGFPHLLRGWLAGDGADGPARAPASHLAPRRGDLAPSPPGLPLAPWLALLAALLFVLERVLATGRRR